MTIRLSARKISAPFAGPRLSGLILAVVAMFAAALVAAAAVLPVAGQDAVVRAVMFYSPTCPHCHQIITEVLPALEDRHGDQLELHLINADAPGGTELFREVLDWFGVPNEERGVPAIVIGEQMYLGDDIDAGLESAIQTGLASGGVAWPAIPGLAAALPEHGAGSGGAKMVADMSVRERLSLDPTGSLIAIVVLMVMLVSLLLVVLGWLRGATPADVRLGWRAWAIPLLALIGLLIAAYLAYVETTTNAAVCGPVGDCNRVQESEYARLFGLLPIGVMGVLGYVLIVGLWAWQRFGSAEATNRSKWGLPLIVLAGTLFSIYLTFLEPFVIGAVCMWCVSSAVVMTALLWSTSGVRLGIAGPESEDARSGQAANEEVGPTELDDVEGPEAVAETPGMGRRLVVVITYLVAAIVGVALGAVLIEVFKAAVPPPLISSVADENRRIAVENALLIGGLLLTPVAWHILRIWWRDR